MTWTIGSSQSASSQTVTSVSITKPTGINTGDLLVAATNVVVAAGGDPGVPTFPSGWTQITSDYLAVNEHGSMRLTTAYKIATGSESSTYSVSWSTSANCSWEIVDISGNAASPLDQSASNPVHSAGTIIAPSLSGLSASTDLLICVFADTGGGSPYTPPAGMTTILNNNQSNNNFGYLAMSYLVLASNSSSTETSSGLGDLCDGVSIAFSLPSSGGGATFASLAVPRKMFLKPKRIFMH
jgi:hypothetical protein